MSRSISALKLQVLSEVSAIIHKALNLEEALQEVLRILSSTLSMERATVTLLDRDSGHLVIMASHGLSEQERQRGVYRSGEGVTGTIFRTVKPLHIPDVTCDPLFLDRTGARSSQDCRISYTGVPIILNNEPIGVLSVDRLFSGETTVQEDIEFLTVLATLIAQFTKLNEVVRAREEELRRENVTLKYQLSKEARGPYIVGKSPPMQEVERQVAKVAPTRATVLLLGESGTGKTLIARIIHDLSDRKTNPFVKVNCASIPENLLESELFGYERGAFTGATGSKAGRFEDANKGSIFLDEIGELSLGLQAKLLRVLQDREFERLGGNRTIRTDVRILTATNRDLRDLVDQGRFRLDLYYRLNVFPLTVPPLRRRKEDVIGLLNHFLRKMAHEYGRDLYFSPEALTLLNNHDWPGNVRELENMVERLVIMAEANRIDAQLIGLAMEPESTRITPESHSSEPAPQAQHQTSQGRKQSLKEIERAEILNALRESNWIKRRAGVALGLTERQIGYRIKKFGLEERVATERMRCRSVNQMNTVP
ncbi:sigma 54-interacting transcriptional regulator [Desulfovibrio ferrophilus]|uniref:Fis family transcriptional regulator n=1 Tax=Desulfovibrio ferrophilus TaxID=241368 RepID=A0A2Z6AYH2_9BACT|nr:sigma 54-interacting transcriptional regulator [Desulfovibrio ferrophilus]BBD08206.1 fis family transcriptional regulator [Desulfovibrio ferrophilus]